MEQLIYELYSPQHQSNSERVQDIQRQIQLLQREKSAWQIGLQLLQHPEEKLRFYGALTLTFKINRDWNSDGLAENESLRHDLLEKLLGNYVRRIKLRDSPLVLQKLCSTLSAYFRQTTPEWSQPVRHLLASLAAGHFVSEHAVTALDLTSAFRILNYDQLRAALWLSLTLVQDIGRFDVNGPNGASLTQTLAENAEAVWAISYLCLQNIQDRHEMKAAEPSMDRSVDLARSMSLVKVVFDIVPLWIPLTSLQQSGGQYDHNVLTTGPLGPVILLVFAHYNTAAFANDTLQLLTQLIQTYPQLMLKGYRRQSTSIVESNQTSTLIKSLLNGDFSDEGVQLVEFLDALVDQEDLSSRTWWSEQRLGKTIEALQRLMRCNGIAVIEDRVCHLALESLSKVVEGYMDWAGESVEDQAMKSVIWDVCESSCCKAAYPLQEMNMKTQSWDADDRAGIEDFRQDVRDFLQSAFASTGFGVIEVLARSVGQADNDRDWPRFESAIFCIRALSEALANYPEQHDSIILLVFGTHMWKMVVDNTAQIPDLARRAVINFVAQNTTFLKRHLDALLPCLNFLFSSLGTEGSTTAAARAINTLCSSQRDLLVDALPTFVGSLGALSALRSPNRQKIYAAIATVIQAVPSAQEKVGPLASLIDALSAKMNPVSLTVNSRDEDSLLPATDVLQTLAAVGNGLRAPADAVIDLDAPVSAQADFWTTGPGRVIQDHALSICTSILQLDTSQSDGTVIEAACSFIKSGYPERDPSPFKWSPSVSVDFISSQLSLENPSISAVMSCASAFLASTTPHAIGDGFTSILGPLIASFESLVATFQSTNKVPDGTFTTATLDFLVRILPKWSSTWLSSPSSRPQESLAIALELCQIVLDDPDTLPRRSASAFVAGVFDLCGPPTPLAPAELDNLARVLQAYNPRIIGSIIRLVGGDCARSEIESLTEPLKKFVSKQGLQAKELLREAVQDRAGVLSQKALASTSAEQRTRFVAQVEGLRGARKTNEVVREFWMACRGGAFGYLS